MLLHLAVAAAVVSLSQETLHESLPNRSVIIDESTTLVLMGTRHGNRLPPQFVSQNPRTWGFEGPSELTQFGKRESFALGKELRKFVGKLVDSNHLPHQAMFYSSSANRCQMTLQALLAAFFPPHSFAKWNAVLDWTPVPYTINDHMLRIYSLKNCPASDAAWAPITSSELPQMKELKDRSASLLQYIANHTKWEASISNAADLGDNLAEIELYEAEYPEWIENPTLKGYDKKKLVREVLEFRELPQIACAEYAPCRELMAGVWLQHIVTSIENALHGQQDPRIIIYASHTEVTLSVMKLLYIKRSEVPPAAGFLVEFRTQPSASVRLLVHDPINVDKHVIYQAEYEPALSKLADSNKWVKVKDFISLVEPEAIQNWEKACRGEDLRSAIPKNAVSSLVSIFAFIR